MFNTVTFQTDSSEGAESKSRVFFIATSEEIVGPTLTSNFVSTHSCSFYVSLTVNGVGWHEHPHLTEGWAHLEEHR